MRVGNGLALAFSHSVKGTSNGAKFKAPLPSVLKILVIFRFFSLGSHKHKSVLIPQ